MQQLPDEATAEETIEDAIETDLIILYKNAARV